ncbi:MAG: tRNA lysidine(34) synthetase TilS, partial [Myxococcales bacterium]|nr:tRNA lysidine(34) synthetase TilS [Myxococcales bacterium]
MIVAVSGGRDSTVLAHALRHRRGGGAELALAHIHHGLRGAEADGDADFVRGLGEKWDVRCAVVRVDPHVMRQASSSRRRPTLQEAARLLRYRALREIAGPEGTIATAHHANDQAETVLLRLLRGTSPEGLRGIPRLSADGCILRPLLGVSQEDIDAYARHYDLSFREDASNVDTRYARNRLRRDWLPGLAEAFNPQLLRAVTRLAEAQGEDADWIEQSVSRTYAARVSERDGVYTVDCREWSA